jgi:hypothetical protein
MWGGEIRESKQVLYIIIHTTYKMYSIVNNGGLTLHIKINFERDMQWHHIVWLCDFAFEIFWWISELISLKSVNISKHY